MKLQILRPCLVSLLIFSFGCASSGNRRPANSDLTLSDVLEQMSEANKSFTQNSHQCSSLYQDVYQDLFNLAGDSAYLDLNDVKLIDQELRNAFSARLQLKAAFKNFSLNTPADADCLKSASDVLRGLRYVEDYLMEIRILKGMGAQEEYLPLQGEFPYLMVNPKFAEQFKSAKDLQSGDVILSRGNAFSSAAIARIGRNDYQFSHLSFVYRDNETKELFTTEAHIEIGSVATPLTNHLSGKNAREVVFRFQDTEVAHQASKASYERVLEKQKSGKNIEYDFSMNITDDSRLFCSEVISSGFKAVMKNSEEPTVPFYKSKFTPGIIPFLNAIGVPATSENIEKLETFSPGDIQFDPRFEMVAEWRNPTKMEESRVKDFILTKIFEKMDEDNYRFDADFKMDVESKSYWLLRRTPLVKKFLAAKFPLNMNPTQMQLFMTLDKVGDALYKEVEKASLLYSRPMTPKEIYDTVDAFWKKDAEHFARFKKNQDVGRPLFHQYFHP